MKLYTVYDDADNVMGVLLLGPDDAEKLEAELPKGWTISCGD